MCVPGATGRNTEREREEGAVIGKPADGRRCWPSSVTLGPCSAPNPHSRTEIDRIGSDFIDILSTTLPRVDLDLIDLWKVRWSWRESGGRLQSSEMIPDTENVCESSEAAVRSTDLYRKIKNPPEEEAASVTAWKRYQQLMAIVESRGGNFNRKSMIEAIFRGNDLVYASH